jgi:hypothetical protein
LSNCHISITVRDRLDATGLSLSSGAPVQN